MCECVYGPGVARVCGVEYVVCVVVTTLCARVMRSCAGAGAGMSVTCS